jgi:hypothetical protein
MMWHLFFLIFTNFLSILKEDSSLKTFTDLCDHLQVACMQFVNIVVHSVEDMNFRVHLQYEFTKLGLDDYLEKLRHTESEELQVCNLLLKPQ